MKIYTKIKIDLLTDEIIEEESFEYSGEVSECKGGSDGYDKEYNRRMADIAERTAEMSEDAFDVWNTGGTGQVGGVGSGRALEVAQNVASQELLPYQTGYEQAGLQLGTKQAGYKSDLMNKFYSELGKDTEGSAVRGARSDVASAITEAKSSAVRDAQRRGVAPPTGGYGLEGAKLQVGAISGARDRSRAQKLGELAQGITI